MRVRDNYKKLKISYDKVCFTVYVIVTKQVRQSLKLCPTVGEQVSPGGAGEAGHGVRGVPAEGLATARAGQPLRRGPEQHHPDREPGTSLGPPVSSEGPRGLLTGAGV